MSKKVLIIIILSSVVVLGGLGAGFFIMWQKLANLGVQNVQASPAEADKKAEVGMGPTYHLDPFIVNLADEGGKRFLRVTMELEVKNDEMVKQVEDHLPKIKDSILMVLPTKKYADLHTVDGKVALRDQIMKKINGFLKDAPVTHIYFTEFVIQ
jgi:flagellar FliL protein